MRENKTENPNKYARDGEEQQKHKQKHGFNGRTWKTNTLPWARPYPSETAPAIIALWVSIVIWLATGAWFAISFLGYTLYFKLKNPLPQGETMNIERIFNEVPLNRWAVNTLVSVVICFFAFLQMVALILYRLDRRTKRDFAAHILRGVLGQDARGDVDAWDDGAIQYADMEMDRERRKKEMQQHGESSRRDKHDAYGMERAHTKGERPGRSKVRHKPYS